MESADILYSIVYVVIFTILMITVLMSLYHFDRHLKLILKDERRKHFGVIVFFIPALQTDEMKFHLNRACLLLLIAGAIGTGMYFLEGAYGKPSYMHQ